MRIGSRKTRLSLVLAALLLCAAASLTSCSEIASAADGTESAASDENAVIKDGVYIGNIAVGGMTAAEAAAAVDSYVESLLNTSFTLVGANGSITLTGEEMGITADTDTCVSEALGAASSGNLIQRFKEQQALDEGDCIIELTLSVDKQQTAELIYAAKSSLDIEAVDNTLVRENGSFTYVEGQDGEEVDVVASVYAINSYLANDWTGGDSEITLVNTESSPRGTEEEFSHITDLLGSYSTNFSSSSASRATNVKNGCEKINGTILYPGEEFSVYEAVSPFTEENGYELAGSYENGTTVESFGGGICQVSTTLYNAVIRAELEVTMRYSHSMMVAYVSPSEDAAIAGTYKDMRFVNNYDYPIYIEGYCSGGVIYFNIYGEETRASNRSISFESEIVETTEPETQITLDSSVAYGSYYTEQTSHTGYVARLWKIVTVDGVEESRTVFNNSTYQASPTIVVFGTKGATEKQLAALKAAASEGDLAAAKAAATMAAEEETESESESESESEEETETETEEETESESESAASESSEGSSEKSSEAGSEGTGSDVNSESGSKTTGDSQDDGSATASEAENSGDSGGGSTSGESTSGGNSDSGDSDSDADGGDAGEDN